MASVNQIPNPDQRPRRSWSRLKPSQIRAALASHS